MNSSTEKSPLQPPAPKDSPKAKMMTWAAVRHAVPFGLWLGIMLLAHLMHLTESSGSDDVGSLNLISDANLYALRTVLCALALLVLRPWKYYSALKTKNILPAIGIGTGIFFLWIGFETQFVKQLFPEVSKLYEMWLVKPFGELRAPMESVSQYDPSLCGWPLTIVRLAGSAFVISVIEEFFWRGYLLRTVRTPDFLDVDIGEFHLPSFLVVAAVFAIEHVEVGAGFVTGLVYGWFYIKTKDIWAASIAHIVTNLLLGINVIAAGNWQYW